MNPEGPVAATFFDGQSARRWPAWIEPSQDGLWLIISRDGAESLRWPLDRLRALEGQSNPGELTITLLAQTEDEAPRDPARLIVTDPAAVAWLRRTRPGLMRRDMRPGTFRKVAFWLGGAAAAIVLMLFVILPNLANLMADHLPVKAEVAFGKSVMKQIQWFVSDDDETDLTCTDPAGLAALAKLNARLVGDRDLGYDLQISVFDHKMVNAFAVPGGQIVIFRGLLDEASSADEVAGVLGHEIGHVVARDPTRLSLRAAGSAGILSIALGDISGGAGLALAADHLLQTSYTREAEAAADIFALGLLNDARISSAGMAAFFDRIAALTDGMPEYLSSHPLSGGRAEAARNNAAGQNGHIPALTPADWQALRHICKG
ncbi:MAG: M48 family metallopeptidase [Albidovulum sp.]